MLTDEKLANEDLASELANISKNPTIGRSVSDGNVYQQIPLKKWLQQNASLNHRFTHPGYSAGSSKPTEDRSVKIVIRAKNGKIVVFYCVFDGHGGSYKVSDRAVKLATETIIENGLENDSQKSIRELLKFVDGVLIPACLAESRANGGCGSTGNITAITSDKRVYNLSRGDSRAEFYNACTGEILFSSIDQDVEQYLATHDGRPPPGASISRCGKYFICNETKSMLMMSNAYGDVNCRFIDYRIPIEITECQLPLDITIVMISTTDGLYEIYKVQFTLNRITNTLKKSGQFCGFVEERQQAISKLIIDLFHQGEIENLASCLIEDQIQHTCRLYSEHLESHSADDRARIEAELSVDELKSRFESQFDNHDGWVNIILPNVEVVGGRSVTI
jgi:serine/threonine protein phosphatase PrpC